MKNAVLVLCAVLCLGSAAWGQNLTPEDRENGVKYLEKTRQGVIDATSGLTEAQWKFKPAADRWSVAEVVEHIATSEEFLYENAVLGTMKSPAGAPDRDYKKIDAAILANVPDRTNKRKAPAEMVPTGKWSGPEALDHFLKGRDRDIEFLKNTPDLRGHVSDGPFGPMDAYQWLIFISAHSERHTKQILEVKADPNFPKK
jgi:hypothetical protein